MVGGLNNYWWQYIPERLNPVLLKLGPVVIHYYGLCYLLSILTVYFLCLHRLKKENFSYSRATLENFFTWVVIGVLLGARAGYVLFYNLSYFVEHPLEIILPFSFSSATGLAYTGISGMSYHGGLIGACIAGVMFCRRHKIDFWGFADFFIPAVPLGYTFGRLGNFFNAELYGRPTKVIWGMYFPTDASHQLRHPSQLYEALFEGLVLFAIFWGLRKRNVCKGCLLAFYLIGYGLVRFFLEFFREPDPQLGLVLGPFTLGQVFCFLMIIAGLVIFMIRKSQRTQPL